MLGLELQAWLTIAVIVAIAGALLRDMGRPDLIFLGGLGVLLLAGVIVPEDAFSGFSNTAVLTVGALFVVAAGVQQTEALSVLDRLLFGESTRLRWVLPRLMLPTACLSAFLNNTPIVAMLTPRVQQWAQRTGLPASKLLIPLSYAAIVGGMMTLIGTSTNIIVSGLLVEAGQPAMGMFDLTWIGLPAMLVVVVYFAVVGHRLLPASKLLIPLSYAAIVGGMMTLIGTSTNIIVSGLLVEAGQPAMGMFDLTWIGLPAMLVVVVYFAVVGHRLLPDRGLGPPILEDGLQECLFEVRVGARASLIGQTVEEAGLRALGDAFLVHVRRRERLMPASPNEVLEPGDVLTFTGNVAMLDVILQRPGLERNVSAVETDGLQTLPLFEAVVVSSSSLVGKSLREVQFREHYRGVVLAIQRSSARVEGPWCRRAWPRCWPKSCCR